MSGKQDEKSLPYQSFFDLEVYIPEDCTIFKEETLNQVKNHLQESDFICECDFGVCEKCEENLREQTRVIALVDENFMSMSEAQWTKYKKNLSDFIEANGIRQDVTDRVAVHLLNKTKNFFSEHYEEREDISFASALKELGDIYSLIGGISIYDCVLDLMDPPPELRGRFSQDIETPLASSMASLAISKAFISGHVSSAFMDILSSNH